MAKTITVNTATLRSKAEELKGLNQNFKTQVENLKTQETSLSSMWQGDANTEFHNAFQKDVTQMDNFYNAIQNYVTTLNEIAQKYDDNKKKNHQLASARKY